MLMFQMRQMFLQSKGLDLGLGFLFCNKLRKDVQRKMFRTFEIDEIMIVGVKVMEEIRDRIEDDN
jgi:hypothetical protein